MFKHVTDHSRVRINYRYVLALSMVLLVALLSACAPSAETISTADRIAIYEAVIRQLQGPDDTFGGTLEKPTIYIVSSTDDQVGDPSYEGSASQILSNEVQAGITSALADLPSRIVWVENFEDVPRDPETGSVVGGGVIITLGNIQMESRDKVLVPGSIYIANLAAGGATYVVEKEDGQWVVTGTTGPRWIS